MRCLPTHASVGRQRGVTMLGLMFWAVLIGFAGYVTVRVLPTVNEFITIQRLVDKVAVMAPATVPETRSAYDKLKEVDYGVESVQGNDLDITKDGDKVVIRFAYTKEIPLFGPASLLLRYEGHSR